MSQTLNVVASPVIFDNKLYALADDGSLLSFSTAAPDAAETLRVESGGLTAIEGVSRG